MFTKSEHKVLKQILDNKDKILNGVFAAIDPASKSLGFAVYVEGELAYSGDIKAKATAPIGIRLEQMIKLINHTIDRPVDVLAIEKLRTSAGHFFIVWAAGAAVGAVGASATIEIPVAMWKRFVGKDHEKSDENDARAIGDLVMWVCKEYECQF